MASRHQFRWHPADPQTIVVGTGNSPSATCSCNGWAAAGDLLPNAAGKAAAKEEWVKHLVELLYAAERKLTRAAR